MNKGAKIAITAGIVLVGSFLASKAYKYKKIADQLTIDVVGFRVHRFIGKVYQLLKFQVELAIDIKFTNPTSYDIKLAIPSVKIFFDNVMIGQTVPNLQEKTIKGGDITTINNILLQVPVKKLIGLGIGKEIFTNKDSVIQALSKRVSFQVYAKVNGMELILKESLSGLGQLGITAGPREIKDGTKYNHLFPTASKAKKVIKPDGDVDNVVETMIQIVTQHSDQVKKLADKLSANSINQTCSNIFDLAYNYMQYQRDTAGIEELRTPARAWYDGQIRFKQQGDKSAGIDCDDYAIFVGSLLHQLHIPFKFRITKYYGRSYFQHVYVAVPHNGKEIIIDPVLDTYNYEKPYTAEKSDFDMGELGATGRLNGIGMLSNEDHAAILSLANASDFEKLESLNGLDGVSEEQTRKQFDNALFNTLKKTREQVKRNPQVIEHVQNPGQLTQMLDQAIKYWNTPKREAVIDKLAQMEASLEKAGLINQGELEGIDLEVEDPLENWQKVEEIPVQNLEESFYNDGSHVYTQINGSYYKTEVSELGGFFKRIKKGINHIKSRIKKGVRKIGTAIKKVGKFIAQHNPATIAIRLGVLAGYRLNFLKLANRLAPGYLSWKEAEKEGYSKEAWKKNKATKDKIEKMFKKLGGNRTKFRRAVAKGNRKNRKFPNPIKPSALSGLGMDPGTMTVVMGAGVTVLNVMDAIIKRRMAEKEQKKLHQAEMQKMDKQMHHELQLKKMDVMMDKKGGVSNWIKRNKLVSAGIGVGVVGLTLLGIYKLRRS
jgi:hypothetical protein